MQIKTNDGNNISGSAGAIVHVLMDTHWTFGEDSTMRYMERVKGDAKMFFGADVNTESPQAFLESLARNGMIEIVEE